MSPLTGLAQLLGNFSLVDLEETLRNTTQLMEHKLVSFETVVALWTHNFTNKANSHTRNSRGGNLKKKSKI